MKFQNLPVLSIVLCAAVLCCGCGGGDDGVARIDTQGTITFEGQPLPKGRIVFEPDISSGSEGPQGYAEIENGEYDTRLTGKGPVPGPQIVTITGYDGNVVPAGDGSEGSPLGAPLFNAWKTKYESPDASPAQANFTVVPEEGLKPDVRKRSQGP